MDSWAALSSLMFFANVAIAEGWPLLSFSNDNDRRTGIF